MQDNVTQFKPRPVAAPARATINSMRREYFRALERERQALEECFALEREDEL